MSEDMSAVTATCQQLLKESYWQTFYQHKLEVMYSKSFQIAFSMLKVFHCPHTQSMLTVGPVWSLQCTDGDTLR